MEKQERKEKKEAFGSEVPIDSDSQSSNDNSLRASQIAVITTQNVEKSTKVIDEDVDLGSPDSAMNEANNTECQEQEIEIDMADTEMIEIEEEENVRKYRRLNPSPHSMKICVDASSSAAAASSTSSCSSDNASPKTCHVNATSLSYSPNSSFDSSHLLPAPACPSASGYSEPRESEFKFKSSNMKLMAGPILNVTLQSEDAMNSKIIANVDNHYSGRGREEPHTSKSFIAAPSSFSPSSSLFSSSYSFPALAISSDGISTSSLIASLPVSSLPMRTAIVRNLWNPSKNNISNVNDTFEELSPSDFLPELGSGAFTREPEVEFESKPLGCCNDLDSVQMRQNAIIGGICTLDDDINVGYAKGMNADADVDVDAMIIDSPKDKVAIGVINSRGAASAQMSGGSRLKIPISHSDGKGREKLKSNSNNFNNSATTTTTNYSNINNRKISINKNNSSHSHNNNNNNSQSHNNYSHKNGLDRKKFHSKHPIETPRQNDINNDSNDSGNSDGKSSMDSNNSNSGNNDKNSNNNNNNNNNNNDNNNNDNNRNSSSNQQIRRYDSPKGNLVSAFKSKIKQPTLEKFGERHYSPKR